MTSATSRPTFAERAAAATAADRDRFIDAVRAGSLLVVVLGHWLMATVTVDAGRVEGGNALTAVPALQPATWVLQVMPLFFIAGGFSNLTVWHGLRRRGAGYPAYLQGRMVRLLRPTLAFVLFWQLALPVAAALGPCCAGTSARPSRRCSCWPWARWWWTGSGSGAGWRTSATSTSRSSGS